MAWLLSSSPESKASDRPILLLFTCSHRSSTYCLLSKWSFFLPRTQFFYPQYVLAMDGDAGGTRDVEIP